jgi:hypothetical protein
VTASAPPPVATVLLTPEATTEAISEHIRRFWPVIDPRFSYRAEEVVATLEWICVATGFPKTAATLFWFHLGCSPTHHAAVDVQSLAGDEAGVV